MELLAEPVEHIVDTDPALEKSCQSSRAGNLEISPST